jgi:hypothetical protein
VDFASGHDFVSNKSGSAYVRAVRGDHPVLSVSPRSRNVTKDAGTTTFSVSNTGTGTMSWNAEVTPDSDWLSITSGASGANSGTIIMGGFEIRFGFFHR